jgi:hypothetical protein
MNGLTLNLFGLALILTQIGVHFFTYIKVNVLFTMHPNEGEYIDRLAFMGGLLTFAFAMLMYVLTN